MGRKRSDEGQETSPVRITDDALRLARIASSVTNQTLLEFVSEATSEKANAIISEFSRQQIEGEKKATKKSKAE